MLREATLQLLRLGLGLRSNPPDVSEADGNAQQGSNAGRPPSSHFFQFSYSSAAELIREPERKKEQEKRRPGSKLSPWT